MTFPHMSSVMAAGRSLITWDVGIFSYFLFVICFSYFLTVFKLSAFHMSSSSSHVDYYSLSYFFANVILYDSWVKKMLMHHSNILFAVVSTEGEKCRPPRHTHSYIHPTLHPLKDG